MILDQYTNQVPTGTFYSRLTYYTEYSDAGSVDSSPFRIDKRTNNTGGILFYGQTELIAEENANTFRLTSTTGNFDLNSFNLALEFSFYGDGVGSFKLKSSTGEEITYASEFSESEKNLSWANVEWVDFTSQSAKAQVSNFNLTATAVPEPSTYAAIFGAIVLFGTIGFRRRAKQTADQ